MISRKLMFGLSALILTFSTLAGAQEMKKAPLDTVFGQGEPNPYGKYFTGQTYLQRLSANDETWHSSLANVTFEPGARTNWHKHSGGQILLVLDGEGRYQEPLRSINNETRFAGGVADCRFGLCRLACAFCKGGSKNAEFESNRS